MNLAELKTAIKNKSGFKRVYLLYGQESYLKKYYLNRLTEAANIALPELNIITADAKDLSLQEYADAMAALPVMSEKKLVIIKDLTLGTGMTELKNAVCESLEELPDDTILILYQELAEVDEKAAQHKKFIELVNRYGSAISFERAQRRELADWVVRRFAANKISCDMQTAEYLLDVCENLMTSLINEIEKLSAYAENRRIEIRDIDEMASKSPDALVFHLTDAVSRGKYSDGIGILNDLFLLDFEISYIASGIYKAVIQLYKASCAAQNAVPAAALAKSLRIPEFAARFYINRAKELNREYLKESLSLCVKADAALKGSAQNGRTVLINLISGIKNVEKRV